MKITPVAGNRRPTVEQVISAFSTFLGIGEDGTNHNSITSWFGADGPWCAMAVSAAFYVAGGKTGLGLIGGKTAATEHLYDWANDHGMIHTSTTKIPRGAVLLFDLGSPMGGRPLGIHHTGLCLADLGNGKVASIEGNTSNDCKKRTRAKSGIAAWFMPNYAASTPAVVVAPPPKPKVYFWVAVVTQSAILLGDLLDVAADHDLAWRFGVLGSTTYFLTHGEGAYADAMRTACSNKNNTPVLISTPQAAWTGIEDIFAQRWPSVSITGSSG